MKGKISLRTGIILAILLIVTVNSFEIIYKALQKLQKYSRKPFDLFLANSQKNNAVSGRLGINQTILKENLKGNILIVDNYALIPQNNDEYPWIIRLNLQTAQTQTFKYPKVANWSNFIPTVLSDLKNGDLSYGVSSDLLIIDKKTLAFKQAITFTQNYIYVFDCHVYIDTITKERRMIAQVGSNAPNRLYQLKQNQLGVYSLQQINYLLGEPYSDLDFQTTGLNTGVIVRWTNITYLQNLNGLIDQSYDRKYYLSRRQQVAVSYNEHIFVTRNDNSYYQFYLLDQKYDFKIKQSILISYNQHRRAEFTTDDKILMVSMSNPRKIHNIAKVIVEKNEFVLVTDSDGVSDNHIDFILFPAETDRMIVLALKGSTYVLQLRTISTLVILHQLPLKFNFTLIDIKLVGNIEWGFSFAMAAQFTSDYREEQNAYLYRFVVQGDKISQTSVMGKFYFDNIRSCSKYFVSYKAAYIAVKVFHASNFTLAKTITSFLTPYLRFQKNILLIGWSQQLQLYDFSKSLDYQGVIFTAKQILSQSFSFIFAKRGVYLQLANREYFYHTIMRAVYNISLPSANKVVMMEINWSYIHCQQYFQQSEKGLCNKVYYIWRKADSSQIYNMSIVEYDECSKNIRSFPYSFQSKERLKLILSSDRKYFISVFSISNKENSYDGYWIEIRERKNLSLPIFMKQYSFGYLDNRDQFHDLKVDFVDGSQLIIKSNNFIKLESINSLNRQSKENKVE